MNNISITKGVYYVGAVDWDQRDFHGYATGRGVTYNSYLIVDEKVCLVDAVKAPFAEEFIDRIKSIIDPSKIDYIVVNHVEPDHSSALPQLMAVAPNAKVVLTAHGKTEVLKYYQQEYDFMVVKEGDSISLGQRNLSFIPLPMIHWPDSMACYLDGDNILFSNDAFGQHLCTSKRFDDEVDMYLALEEAGKYYANILMPFNKLVARALPKIKALDIKIIAPSHGICWRGGIEEIFEKYEKWSNNNNDDKVIIVYDSMWGATEKMARMILDGVASTGVDASLYRVNKTELSEVMAQLLEAKGIIIGSSTHNNSVLKTIGGFLTYLQGLKPTGKLCSSFGAYGWAGGADKTLAEVLAKTDMEVEPGLFVKWTPDKVEIDKCFEFGVAFGEKILSK